MIRRLFGRREDGLPLRDNFEIVTVGVPVLMMLGLVVLIIIFSQR